jgi:hypothetical protein
MPVNLLSSGGGTTTLTNAASASNFTLTLPASTGTIGLSGAAVTRSQLPTGSVLQVVSTTITTQQTFGSASMTDVVGLSASITPTSASNRILVILNLSCSASGNRDAAFQTLRGATVIPTAGITGSLLNASNGAYINSMLSMAQSFLDSPATTSSTTYKIQVAINGDFIYVNRRALDGNFTGQSTITLMEIAA